ncbi:MAG: hypothetical protein E7482_07240 [Ruminococcaceae bacterium]|nr:hypothetical protein [Oscillospiraceae bacterium]
MKKLFSVLIAFVLAFAMGTAAFAEPEEKEIVAEIKGKEGGYTSIQAAVNDAAVKGDTIVVIKSHELKSEDVVTLGGKYNTLVKVAEKSVTIDLNGKELSCEYDGASMLVGFFSTDDNGHLTIVDTVGGAEVNVKAKNTVYGLLVNYEEGCSLTVKGGSFVLDKASDSIAYSGCSASNGPPKEGLYIEGGNFYLDNVGTGSNGSPWIFNVGGRNDGHAYVTGGTFNADVNHQYWAFEVDVPNTRALKNNGDETWTVVDSVAYVTGTNSGYAREVGYATLKEAVKSDKDGNVSTVTLTKDNDEDIEISGRLKFELNGKKYTGKITLTKEGTVLEAPEGLEVVSSVDDHIVIYKDGAYSPLSNNEHPESHQTTSNEYAPTCIEEGYSGDVYCNDCQGYLSFGKVIPATGHKDEDKDHDCDNGCQIYQGEHKDDNKDHACDYGCKVEIGEHSDADKDHACDYGCSEAISDCSDKNDDGDHDCDVCGEENITEHSWKDATCTEAKTCTECGETEGSPLAHEYGRWVKVYEPTETEPGVKVKTCHECGKKVYADVAPLSEDGIEELGPGAEKPETETEQNPNTGAPVFAPAVILVSAAAAFFKKR